ncbi:putative tetratricopeptide-like helical domain-containing protein [Rosa chinensis]|uniref:Putative tetratricopeptide-like helical domain-containing protein n=1 Tax=Rosa chinensis TaxID=74649 RepID=A0A2P6QT10_ROSCH|nr:putative tetratricopeptide-like helical domain-containing protein [Rosa chinensis]
MEGTLFPSRPVLPIQTSRPIQPSPPVKFNATTLPPLPQTPSSFPIDSLLQHLLNISSPPNTPQNLKPLNPPHQTNAVFPSLQISVDSTPKQHQLKKPTSVLVHNFEDKAKPEDGLIDFLTVKGKMMFNSIVESPLHCVNELCDSAKFELLEVDLISLLKALDLSGNWERALLLFEWIMLNLHSESLKLDKQIIELMVRILGRESQHTIASKLFEVIPIEEYSLDVRAYTTVIHAYSRTGKYERAIDLFEKLMEMGLSPTLVTYNVMLDVYGKKGRSWNKILGLLAEMKSKGFEFDDFTCSTVISACGREGLLDEAKEFFAGLKSQGYVPGTVTYNSLLQVFGKAGVFMEALSILKEMEDNNCPPDAVTYNELVAAYVRAGFAEEGASVLKTMTQKGTMPNAVTYTTVINAYGRAGKEEEALRLFNQMKETGCVPNVCTYNAVLAMLGKKSRPEEMIKILCDMKSSGCAPNRITWNTMLAMCGDKGKHKYVNQRHLQYLDQCIWTVWVRYRCCTDAR